MITFDAFEQMDAESLELIGADAGRHGRAGFIQIGVISAAAKRPHGHAGDGHRLEQDIAVTRDHDG